MVRAARIVTAAAIAVLICSVLLPGSAVAQSPPPTSSLIVKLVPGLSPEQQAAVITRNGGTETSVIPALRLHVVEVLTSELPSVLANYEADIQVISVEENKTRQIETAPSDPLYPDQWALPKIGWDMVFGALTPTGTATVAVLDTGVDASHPDLAGNVIPGTSILNGSSGMTDPGGHGTLLAGIIAARCNSEPPEGIAGVAYAGVRIMPVTVLGPDGLGQDSDVIAGVIWAAEHGANVILMGFSNPGFSQNLQDAIDYAWSSGAVLVAAAGNGAMGTPTFPAGDRGVMGVSATDSADSLASFSNSGQAVFVAAPGVGIETTAPGCGYSAVSGTSTSAAVVAGVAAFMKAADPTLTNGVIVGRIARMADPAGTQEQTGNGRINMPRALADTSTDPVQPAGAAPVGGGGPFVGPYVPAADTSGNGAMAPTSQSVTAFSTGHSFTWTFTASQNMNNAKLTMDVPAGWTQPQTSLSTSPGFVSVLTGNCASVGLIQPITGSGPWTIPVPFSCTNNKTFTLTYAGGGSEVTAPGVGTYQFTTKTQDLNTSGSTLTAIAASPSVTVTKANQAITVTMPAPGSAAYNSSFNVAATASSGLIVAITTTGGCSGTGSGSATITMTSPTTACVVHYNQAGDTNYNAAPEVTSSTSATKANQTITFGALANKTYGDADFGVTATASSGLAVTFTASGNCTVAGSTVHITSVGSCTVTAHQAGDGNYNAAPDVPHSFSIAQKSVTVTADAKAKVYGNPDPALTYQVTSGALVAGDSFSGALTRVAGESVAGGPYAIQQGTLALSSNYTLTFVGANLSITPRPITVTADAKTKVYGDADPALTYQVTSGALQFSDTFSGALTRVAGESVAGSPYAIQQGTLSAGTNYTLTFVGANLSITPRPITVTGDAKTKVYGDADPALTYQITSGSLVGADSFAGSLTRAAGENVGTHAIQQGTLSAGTNYTLTYVGANLAITPRPITVAADAKAKMYGDVDPTLTYQVTSGSLVSGDSFSGSPLRAAGESVGSYAIGQGTLTAGANYNLTFFGALLTITARPITVTADAKTKAFGDADPALTYQVTSGSLAFSDAFSGALTRVAGETVAGSPYLIQQGTLALSSNYMLTFVGANLTINKAAVTGTVTITPGDPLTVPYGDPVTATVTIQPYSFAGEQVIRDQTDPQTLVTTYAGFRVYLVPVGGTLAQAQLFGACGGPAACATLQTTLDNQNNPTGLEATITGVAPAPGQYLAYVIGDNAGDNPGLADEGFIGTDTANIAYPTLSSNQLDVVARAVTVTADAKTKVYGDADPALTYQVTSGSLAAGDSFSGALTRAAGQSVGTYAIQQGTLALSSNYTLTYVSANLAITPRPITVTADAKTKVYGNPDPALTYQVTSGALVAGDSFSGALTRVPGESVASSPYAIQQGTLSAGTNYTLTFVGANLAITPRPITVTADAKTKVYGDADPALTYQVTSGALVAGDSFSGVLARAAGEGVAGSPYAIQQGTLALNSNYNLTFVGASLTITARAITATADAKTKVYGDADPALTYQVTSGALQFSDTFSGALTRVAGETVASSPYAIQQGTLALSSNYALTFVGANLSIMPRPITVTADAKTKVYGDADPALTYQITSGSLVGADSFAGSLTRAAGENVGTHAIQQGTLSAGTNYTLTFVGANLTITPRPITVTADAKTKVYGDADPALTYQVTSGTLVSGDSFSGSPLRAAGESAGSYAIGQGTLTAGTNYNLTFFGALLTITARPITVTADAKTKAFGDADPALTYQVTSGSLAFSDAFSGALTRVAGETVAGSPYLIQQGTLALSSNYMLTFVGANLTINKAAVTGTVTITPGDPLTVPYGDPVTATVTIQPYSFAGEQVIRDQTDPQTLATTYAGFRVYLVPVGGTLAQAQLFGACGGPAACATLQTTLDNQNNPTGLEATITGVAPAPGQYLAYVVGDNAGDNPSLADEGFIGTDTANISYPILSSGQLDVVARVASVTPNAASKTYGAADPAFTGTLTGFLVADGVTATYSRTAGETVAGSPYTISATLAPAGVLGNYDITYNTANFTINKATASVTPAAASKTYGAADPALTGTLSGFVAADGVTPTYSRTAGETVAGSPYTISATLAPAGVLGNYDITYNTASFTINKATASVTPAAASKTYGAADPALTGTLSGFVAADGVTPTYSRTAGETVAGSPYTISATLAPVAVLSNYSITYNTASFTISTAATTTAITSHMPTPSVVGQGITVIITVSAVLPGGGMPAGSVTVNDGSGEACTTTVAAGTGTCQLTPTTVGTPKILTAIYAPDTNYTGSTSAGVPHTVNKAATTTTITTPLASEPSAVGQPLAVHYTVTANAPGSGTPTGNVTVTDGTISCTATVAAHTCSLTFTTAGVRNLKATYAGDTNFITSASAVTPHTANFLGSVGTLDVFFVVNNIDDDTKKPKTHKEPIAGAEVRVFIRGQACPDNLFVTKQPKHWSPIFETCPFIASWTTNANGEVLIKVPPTTKEPNTDYVVIGKFIDSDPDPDSYYSGKQVNNIKAGETRTVNLRKLRRFDGKHCSAHEIEEFGTHLVIVEPDYIDWTDMTEQYPFVLEADGDWDVTTSLTPPDGFVPDVPALSIDIVDSVGALQFTLTDVGSDWTQTSITHLIKHKGKTIKRNSEVKMFDKKKDKKTPKVKPFH